MKTARRLLAKIFGLLLILFSSSTEARNADSELLLIQVSTRFVLLYVQGTHAAGNADGVYLEDVVLPAMTALAHSGNNRLSDIKVRALLDFVVASDSLASELVGDIAYALYISDKSRFCKAVAKSNLTDRALLMQKADDGRIVTKSYASMHAVSCP